MNRSLVSRLRQTSHPSSVSRVHHPFLYRREISVPNQNFSPSLTVTKRLKLKENLIFGGAPNFHKLKDDDRANKSNVPKHNTPVTEAELKEFVQKEKAKQDKKKQRKKEIPKPEEIREHLRVIVTYHKKEVEQNMPTAYPLLGPAGKEGSDNDSDTEESTATADRANRSLQNRSGRKRQLSSVFTRNEGPPLKRGRK
jgi:hypothetical protein